MNKLTVIVGAGASCEFGLPIGAKLKSTIASLLNIRFDTLGQRESGDSLILQSLRLVAKEWFWHENINSFMPALQHICEAMAQAASIDNFIDTHQGNEEIEICGKLAIARAILNAERNSTLHVDPGNFKNKLNFERIRETWLNPLLMILMENCRVADLEERLSRLRFVIFNYDRCIEHYFYHWIRSYYNQLPDDQVAALVNSIEIFHPYGTVGRLPWQTAGNDSMPFGADSDQHRLLKVAREIKTFTEGTNPGSSDILQIRNLMQTSERIVFLGFAYHKLNLKLLNSGRSHPKVQRRIFGTASGISDHNCDLIRQELSDGTHIPYAEIELRNDLLCNQLIHEYSRSLAIH